MEKNGQEIFKSKSIKIITSEQKKAKKSNNYLDV